jgi:hypothetical protein
MLWNSGVVNKFGKPTTTTSYIGAMLSPIIPNDKILQVGLGTMYVDIVGVYFSVIVSKMLQLFIGSPPTPIYADIAGVMMGHLCGIFLPYWYFKWFGNQGAIASREAAWA